MNRPTAGRSLAEERGALVRRAGGRGGGRSGPSAGLGWAADPSCGVISLNSPRAGRQQGQVSSGGCTGGPCLPGCGARRRAASSGPQDRVVERVGQGVPLGTRRGSTLRGREVLDRKSVV